MSDPRHGHPRFSSLVEKKTLYVGPSKVDEKGNGKGWGHREFLHNTTCKYIY
jgi:hypothetical protein